MTRFQQGDLHSGWMFVEHHKIKAIIRGRMRQFRAMFTWLPTEDIEDVECSLRPRILEIAKAFSLEGVDYDGKIISYFSLRIRGEADHILKKVTGMKQVTDKVVVMKQVVDEVTGLKKLVSIETDKTYLKSFSQPIDGMEEVMPSDVNVEGEVITNIEDTRQGDLLQNFLDKIPTMSNDRVWLKCYLLRLAGKTWANVANAVGYRQTDNTFLKDNTARFVTRLKDKLIRMGEDINYCICGIYTDDSEVAICVVDSSDKKKNVIWSKVYDTYGDLERIEAKLGDVFRQHEITYVIMNEQFRESRSTIIIMRYLTKREAFVEFVPLDPFISTLPRMPDSVNGVSANQFHRRACLLTHVKRAHLDIQVQQSKSTAR